VDVVEARAEEAARRPELREAFAGVVARSFGPPAVTAECAVGFLRLGARLVVSEPPDTGASPSSSSRWPPDGLAVLGLGPAVRGGEPEASFVTVEKIRSDDRWPRRVGLSAKRPQWSA